MNLPGFTAEASLRRADVHRRAAKVSSEPRDAQKVVPQFGPRLICQQEGTLVSPGGRVQRFICCSGLGEFCFFTV